ncbi:MAG: HEAT repeat domain-containing protein [Methanosarcina sp.]
MKKFAACFAVLIALISGIIIGCAIVDRDVERNISIAMKLHPGTAEDALIAYIQDPAVSAHDKSKIGVWTLGQIKSEKALPVLKTLYKDDPVGKSCRGKHDEVLCQYGLHRAIVAIESEKDVLPTKPYILHTKQYALRTKLKKN